MRILLCTLLLTCFLTISAAEKAISVKGKEEAPLNLWGYLMEEDDAGFKALLDRGANPNFRLLDLPIIAHAALSCKPELVEALLKKGADVNAAALQDKTTALHLAVETHRKEKINDRNAVLRILIQAKADPTAKNDKGQTPLHRAVLIANDDAPVTKLLIAGARVDDKDNAGETPLHMAVKRSNFMTQHNHTQLLIDAGATVNLQDNSGETPLHNAAAISENDFLEKLTQAGASVSIINSEGQTPLHKAAGSTVAREEKPVFGGYSKTYGVQYTIKHLVAQKAQVDAQDKNGRTPLHLALTSEAVGTLIGLGANVNALDVHKRTPLFYAHSAKSVGLLLAAGATVTIKDKDGCTPLHWISYDPIHRAMAFSMIECPELYEKPHPASPLIAAGANVDEKDDKGFAVLFYYIDNRDSEGVRALLEAGVNHFITTPKGSSPLDYAVELSNEDAADNNRLAEEHLTSIIVDLLLAGAPQKPEYESCKYYKKALQELPIRKLAVSTKAQSHTTSRLKLQEA